MKKTLKIPILRTDNKMAKGRTNTDLYSIAQKTNDRATRTLLKSYNKCDNTFKTMYTNTHQSNQ
jgi:hypothetical protein